MRALITLTCCSLLSLWGPSIAVGQELTEQKFVTMVAQGNLTEHQKGDVARGKAQSQNVKEYAARIAVEHGKIYERLEEVAKKINLIAPSELDQEHQRKIKDLRSIPEGRFDRQYMQMMVEDHAKGVQRFEQSIKKIGSPELKTWAEDTLSFLKNHLHEAKTIAR